MKGMKQQKSWLALVALMFLFAACKGESPTAPPPTGGPGPNPTPGATTLVLTASSASPVVDSVVTITATVTVGGQPAPNGTAVEFTANGGSFSSTENVTSILRTTTNGVATVELRSTIAGTVRVQAAVANVTRTVDVTFRVNVPDIPPGTTAPSITAVTPAIGVPTGGQRIHITGTNFKQPLRVLFDTGAAQPIEAFVISSSATDIEVFTPSVNLGVGQQLVADVIVITQAGSTTEQRAELEDAFTFRLEQLTPRVSTASPNSGPVVGGTRVTIFGDGFQAPVQVLFGAAEAQVINVDFGQILVEAPAGRDTAPDGSGTVTGPVDITVRNINSQTATTLTGGFRYVAGLDITAFRPLSGPATGGTDVVIDGVGFVAPVEVLIAGQRATVLQVTGTRILVRTPALASPCASTGGPIQVTNVNNGDLEIYGDSSEEQTFSYIPVPSLITSVTTGIPGGSVTVIVRDPGVGPFGNADIRFQVNGRTVIPSPDRITTGTGTQNFSVVLPLTGYTFPTVACTTGGGGLPGTQFGPTEVPITFQNITTGCTATATVVVNPDPVTNPCLATPEGSVIDPDQSAAFPASCAQPASTTATGAATQDTITIRNRAESQPLNITGVSITGPDAGSFSISPTSASNIPGGSTRNFTVTFDPPATAVPGSQNATVTFTTNSPTIPTLSVCLNSNVDP